MFDKILAYVVSAFTVFLGINRVHEPSVLPKDFVFLDEIVPQIKQEMMYASSNNFTGDVVRGYGVNRAIVTRQAADAIKRVNDELKQEGLGLLVYDAYRPTKAVGAFLEWHTSQTVSGTRKSIILILIKISCFNRLQNIFFQERVLILEVLHWI